jgi:predicted ATP-dependent endonuclease of OLD family
MEFKSLLVHNFRSIKESKFDLYNYTGFVGSNNSGKSNVFTAIRVFYEEEKFNDKIDFPKFITDDKESWIEIEYMLTDDEYSSLKIEYKMPGNVFKVRKYLKSETKGRVQANQSNIYGYEDGKLSDNLFYGAKNVGEAKLGTVIYIPELAKTDDNLKLSGPSPLRDLLTFVMKKVVKGSTSFVNLNNAFDEFNKTFKEEASSDGFSLNELKKQINDNLKEWEVEFNININSISPEDIIKSLVSHNTLDKHLEKEIDVKCLGQGLQRHLIYTLLKLSSQYADKKEYGKKEFSPDFTLILFEEPEAFLHPTQQDFLNNSLKILSLEDGQQIIITTHSPIFVSKNVDDLHALIKFKRSKGVTTTFQVSEEMQAKIISEYNELVQLLQAKLTEVTTDEPTKKSIHGLIGEIDETTRMEQEAMRYLLWLDSERCCAFFSDIIIICEGATEKVLIDYLIKNKWDDLWERKIYVLDSMGKFNIHRYMNLFKELGIYHCVLADKDENNNIHLIINGFIENQKNTYTRSIDFFEKDIEAFLGVPVPPKNRRDRKPLNVLWHYSKGFISQDKIDSLKLKIDSLIQ